MDRSSWREVQLFYQIQSKTTMNLEFWWTFIVNSTPTVVIHHRNVTAWTVIYFQCHLSQISCEEVIFTTVSQMLDKLEIHGIHTYHLNKQKQTVGNMVSQKRDTSKCALTIKVKTSVPKDNTCWSWSQGRVTNWLTGRWKCYFCLLLCMIQINTNQSWQCRWSKKRVPSFWQVNKLIHT